MVQAVVIPPLFVISLTQIFLRFTWYMVLTYIDVSDSSLIYLAKLVGQQNVYKAMKYVELASQGKTIPANIAQGMNPAIQLLVDIVQAGPSYISMLKYVHKQAKNKK